MEGDETASKPSDLGSIKNLERSNLKSNFEEKNQPDDLESSGPPSRIAVKVDKSSRNIAT